MTDPAADPILDVAFFAVGSCRGLERLTHRGGRWRTVRFPALAVLLRHATRGWVLYDTGYAGRYFDVLRRWPYRLLGPLLGARLSPEEALTAQLMARRGVRTENVRTLVVSHFHLDHIAGLRDFPAAEIFCTQTALGSVGELGGGWQAARQVFHPDLLPTDFAGRVRPLSDRDAGPAEGFAKVWDLFGDGSLRAVSLPGHAAGQVGLRFRCRSTEYFLVADACWHEAALHERPSTLSWAERLFSHDSVAGASTRSRLQTFVLERPSVQVVPSHCPCAVTRHVARPTEKNDPPGDCHVAP